MHKWTKEEKDFVLENEDTMSRLEIAKSLHLPEGEFKKVTYLIHRMSRKNKKLEERDFWKKEVANRIRVKSENISISSLDNYKSIETRGRKKQQFFNIRQEILGKVILCIEGVNRSSFQGFEEKYRHVFDRFFVHNIIGRPGYHIMDWRGCNFHKWPVPG